MAEPLSPFRLKRIQETNDRNRRRVIELEREQSDLQLYVSELEGVIVTAVVAHEADSAIAARSRAFAALVSAAADLGLPHAESDPNHETGAK